MPNQLTNHQKEQRSHKMAEVTEQSRQEFLQSQVGKIESVLFETQQADGMQHRYTKTYTPVCVKSDRELCERECMMSALPGLRGRLCQRIGVKNKVFGRAFLQKAQPKTLFFTPILLYRDHPEPR